ARRPSSKPEVERLECRSVPGTILSMNTLGAGLGGLLDAALAPATQLQDVVQPTQGVAVQAAPNASDSLSASVPALVHEQALQTVRSQEVVAARGQGLRSLQTAGGMAGQMLAAQTIGVSGKTGSGTRAQVLVDPLFENGIAGLGGGGPWTLTAGAGDFTG